MSDNGKFLPHFPEFLVFDHWPHACTEEKIFRVATQGMIIGVAVDGNM